MHPAQRPAAERELAPANDATCEIGRMRYSLWTGDLGFAVYLLDCVHGTAAFPTLDVFFTP